MNALFQVYRKESREMLRDKRVRSSALLMPLLIVLVTFALVGFLVDTMSRPSSLSIHALNAEHPIAKSLTAAKMNIIPVANEAEAERLVREGKARLVLEFPEANDKSPQVVVGALFDPKEERSKVLVAQIGEQFSKLSTQALKRVLKERGIPEEAAEPLRLEDRPIQVGAKESAGGFLVQMLPYLIVIWAFFGGMGIVGDLVAGEKEKLTLETLLIAPVRRVDIALGKFLALTQVCVLSSWSALLGVVVVRYLNLPGLNMLFRDGATLSPAMVLTIAFVLIPTAMLFAALMLAVSAFAKNTREAQTHLTLVSFIVLIPAMMSQVIGFLDFAKTMGIYAVPVLNTSMVIRNALTGKTDMLGIAITVLTCGVLAAAGLWIAVRLFNREEILVRV